MTNYSAGVLICRKQENNIQFLLGRDSKYKTWSDFGGKNESIDKCCIHKTASREFFEESCGVIYDKLKINAILKDLTPYHCSSYTNNDYFMYVVYVNDTKDFVTDFSKIHNLIRNRSEISFKFLEKDCLRWFDYNYIMNNEHEFRCVFYKSLIKHIDDIQRKCVTI